MERSSDELREAIFLKASTGYSNELCFVRVNYNYGYPATMFSCLYPITTVTSIVAFPPQPLFRVDGRERCIKAILTLRMGKCYASCDVTRVIAKLQGPLNDFHVSSGSGFQLRRRLLSNLMYDDVQRLVKVMRAEMTTDRSGELVIQDRLVCRLVLKLDGRGTPVVIRIDHAT